MKKILVTEQQFNVLLEQTINELSPELKHRAYLAAKEKRGDTTDPIRAKVGANQAKKFSQRMSSEDKIQDEIARIFDATQYRGHKNITKYVNVEGIPIVHMSLKIPTAKKDAWMNLTIVIFKDKYHIQDGREELLEHSPDKLKALGRLIREIQKTELPSDNQL